MGKTHACGWRGLYFGFVAPLNEPYDTISSRCPPAACRGVLTSHLYAQDYQGSALRAIAALLQAKYSPLLKLRPVLSLCACKQKNMTRLLAEPSSHAKNFIVHGSSFK